MTGFTNVESSLAGKWLELVKEKEIAPGIRRVAILFDPKLAPGGGSYYTRLIETAAPSFAMAPTVAPVHDAVDIERSIAEFSRAPDGGLLALPDATTNTHRELIIALAARHRVPAIYEFRDIVTRGGLISYGVDTVGQFRRAADYVDRVLKSAELAALPVQLPTKYELAINLKTANALGPTVPPSMLVAADEVMKSLSEIGHFRYWPLVGAP